MNAQTVAERFADARRGSGSNIMSTGDRVYSYEMLIAKRTPKGAVQVISVKQSPTRTTSRHINCVLGAVPDAIVVDTLVHD